MNKTAGFFDPRIKNSYSCNVYILVVHSLKRIESLTSACVKILNFGDIGFSLFVLLCDYKNAAPIPKLKALHIA